MTSRRLWYMVAESRKVLECYLDPEHFFIGYIDERRYKSIKNANKYSWLRKPHHLTGFTGSTSIWLVRDNKVLWEAEEKE